MPYYKTSDEWLVQSQLLLEARPTTTRVTTKYAIKPAGGKRSKKGADGEKKQQEDKAEAKPPRGVLVLKTFDPKTGTTLKYRTTKAAEVSRLVLSLGRLGRPMAGLPPLKEDPAALLAAAEGQDSGAATPAAVEEKGTATPTPQEQQKTTGGGGKGKKKKGKR